MTKRPQLGCGTHCKWVRIACIFLTLFTATLITSIDSAAQSKDIKFTYLTREQGLSNSIVNCIFQDSKGYIWIGTEDGLNRFDGYKITVYKHNSSDSTSLSNNKINQIAEDKDHRLWIATNYGLNLYDRQYDRFNRYLNSAGSLKSISSNIVLSLLKDKAGNFWVGTANGLNRFNANPGSFNRYFANPNSKSQVTNSVSFLFESASHNLLVGTDGDGLKSFDVKKGQFIILNNSLGNDALLKSSRITTIKSDLSGKLWIGTLGNGIFRYNYSNAIIEHIEKGPGQSDLSNNVIKGMLRDHMGNIWIGTENGGVNVFNAKTGKFIRYENDNNKPYSFSQKTASCLFEDSQNNIWIGTHRGGINLYTPNSTKFDNYTQGVGSGSLAYKDIKAFFEDKNGDIWVGTDGGGINVWNKVTRQFKQYRHDPRNPASISSDAILSIMQDHENNIWIGTWAGGINKFNRADQTFTKYQHNPKDPTSISSNNAWRLFEDSKHNFWVATYFGGLNLFDPKSGKFRQVTAAPDGRSAFIGKIVLNINEDSEGNLWFGTDDGGLNCLTANKKQFLHYFYNEHQSLTDAVHAIFVDSKKRLWIGKTGLYLFDNNLKDFKLYSKNPSLANEKLEAITEDNHGNLWISTDDGLLEFNPESRYIKRFTNADGLQALEFSQSAVLRTKSNLILFGGYQGFNVFYPDSIKSNNYGYPIYLTDLRVFNKSISHTNNSSLKGLNISEAKNIVLDYDQSVFSFEYAALNYVSPSKTNYAYRMAGFDKGWNYVQNQRTATYTNLDPGDYTFFVKASSPDGLWNTKEASIKVTIKPPFYRTWWFEIFSLLIVLGTAYIVLYYRRKAELVVFHEQKQEEIHQLQLQFFTNISHEFRTPLTLILGTLEQAFKSGNQTTFLKHYHTIQRNANRLMNLISELMDFRKLESGTLKLKVIPGDFSAFLNEIVQDFQEQALLHDIDFSIKTDQEYAAIWFDRQVMEKVLLNLLNNAFKYTPDKGFVKLEVFADATRFTPYYEDSVKLENDFKAREYIYVSITDSGVGISKESIRHLFERYYRVSDLHLGSGIGLAFVKNLIFLHKGHIEVYSEKGRGTQIIIAIPVNKSDYDKSELWLENTSEPAVQLESIQFKEILRQPSADSLESVFEPDNSRRRILIVDDNDELRDYFREVLQPYYTIIDAENGLKGMEKAKEDSPELIISDVMMPIMDGITFCRTIKDDFETSHIPFILLTAKDALQSRLEGIDSGADHYFSKPVSTELLLLTIRNIFSQKLKIKEKYLKDYRSEARELVQTAKDKDFMDKLLRSIEVKLEDPDLNIDFVSREIGISKSQLYKKIKDITGQSSNEFIRTIRLKKAAEIMTHEDVTITEVMYRVGVLSGSYFTKVFKKEFGMTPSQFQQQLENSNHPPSSKNL